MFDKEIDPWGESFIDCAGVKREFVFERIQPRHDGFLLRAREITEKNSDDRYIFSSWSPSFREAVGKLRKKISTGIAVKYILLGDGLSLSHNKMSALICAGWIIVDGKFMEWGELSALLSGLEGFQLDLFISDPAE